MFKPSPEKSHAESSFVLPFMEGLALLLWISLIDWLTGVEVSFSIFYLLAIAHGTWRGGRRAGIPMAAIAALSWLLIDNIGGASYSNEFIPIWNAAVRFGFFIIVTLLLDRVRLLTVDLESLVAAKTAALSAEIQQRRQVEREVAETTHREQERLAYELHDQVGGSLTGLAFQIKALAERIAKQSPAAADQVYPLVSQINDTTEQVRQLALLLAPTQISGDSLANALTELGERFTKVFNVACDIDVPPDLPALSGDQCNQLLSIAKEATRNAVQHGRARTVSIQLRKEAAGLELEVRGDGIPMHPASGNASGLGLRIMRYRAELLGGTLEFRPDVGEIPQGSSVLCRIPFHPPPVSG